MIRGMDLRGDAYEDVNSKGGYGIEKKT